LKLHGGATESQLKGNMGKIVEIRIELDDTVPEYMQGMVRCGSVRSYDAKGKMCIDHKELVDNVEYQNETDMIVAVATRLKFPASMISVVE
jgi:hypothetical protein